MTTRDQIMTPMGGGQMSVMDAYSSETRDIIITIRELCRGVRQDGLAEACVEKIGKDTRWSVKVVK